MNRLNNKAKRETTEWGPSLRNWPFPGKVLVTMIIVMISLGLSVAVGQVIVHDILPTFWGKDKQIMSESHTPEGHSAIRGDLFSETPVEEKIIPIDYFRSIVFYCFCISHHLLWSSILICLCRI